MQVGEVGQVTPLRRRVPEWLVRVAAAGTLATDRDDVRLRKATLTLSVSMITLGGLLWGAIYAALGLHRSATIPLAYSVLSLLNLLALAAWKQYGFFRFTQLTLVPYSSTALAQRWAGS